MFVDLEACDADVLPSVCGVCSVCSVHGVCHVHSVHSVCGVFDVHGVHRKCGMHSVHGVFMMSRVTMPWCGRCAWWVSLKRTSTLTLHWKHMEDQN